VLSAVDLPVLRTLTQSAMEMRRICGSWEIRDWQTAYEDALQMAASLSPCCTQTSSPRLRP